MHTAAAAPGSSCFSPTPSALFQSEYYVRSSSKARKKKRVGRHRVSSKCTCIYRICAIHSSTSPIHITAYHHRKETALLRNRHTERFIASLLTASHANIRACVRVLLNHHHRRALSAWELFGALQRPKHHGKKKNTHTHNTYTHTHNTHHATASRTATLNNQHRR